MFSRLSFVFSYAVVLCMVVLFVARPFAAAQFTPPGCITVPVSLSRLNECVDGTCAYKELANLAIPAQTGAKSCLEFVSPDPDIPPVHVNITITAVFFSRVSDYCYYTDSPAIDSKGFCHCPGALTTGTCPDCDGNPDFTQHIFCSAGLHSDDYCPLDWIGGHGEWCVNTGLSYRRRFKICHMKPIYSLEASFQFQHGSNTWNSEYQGTEFESTDTANLFNITIVSDTAKPTVEVEFLVWDLSSQTDFYIMSSDQVNSLTSSNPQKIGWLKVDDPDPIKENIADLVNIKLLDCEDNKFAITYPWVKIEEFLSNNNGLLSSSISPQSVLVDSDFEPKDSERGSAPNHNFGGNYVYLIDGWMLMSFGLPFHIGITQEHHFNPFTSPSVILVRNSTTVDLVKTNRGDMYEVDLLCQSAVLDDYNPALATLGPLPFPRTGFLCNVTHNAAGEDLQDLTYAWCMYPATGAAVPICSGADFYAIEFPSMHLNRFYFDYGFQSVNENVTVTTETELFTPPSNGVLNILVEFVNMTVKFESQSIKPKIISISQNETKFSLTAQSTTVPGTCYLSTNPPELFIPQSIFLTTQPEIFSYSYASADYNGDASFIINCHMNSDRKSSLVSFNQTETETSNEELISSNIQNSFDPSNLVSLFEELFDGDIEAWGIVGIIFWVIIASVAIAAVVCLLYAFPFIIWYPFKMALIPKKLWMYMRMKKNRAKVFRPRKLSRK